MLYNKLTKNIFSEKCNIFVNKVLIEKPTGMHSHEFIEICLVYSGSGLHSINGIMSSCKKGDYFIINNNTLHEIYPNENMQIYNIVFTPDFIDINMKGDDVDDILQHYIFKNLFIVNKATIKFSAIEEISNLFVTMYEELNAKNTGYIEVLRSKLMLVLIFTLRQANIIKTALPTRLSSVFDNVILYIISNFNKNISLEKLAKVAFVSKEHLCREFKKKLGKTITEFITIIVEKIAVLFFACGTQVFQMQKNI